jgi:hypothetical protein
MKMLMWLYTQCLPEPSEERREEILDMLEEKDLKSKILLTIIEVEDDGFFLEGTGSLLLTEQMRSMYCAYLLEPMKSFS